MYNKQSVAAIPRITKRLNRTPTINKERSTEGHNKKMSKASSVKEV